MFWFIRYTFDWKERPNQAIEKLKTTSKKTKWEKLVSKFDSNKVELHYKLPAMFYNSWNPIFVGEFKPTTTGSQLVGYFRVHWFTMIFMIFFLGFCIFNIYSTWIQPEVKPGYVENWKSETLKWEFQFLGMVLLIIVGGWLIGLFNQKKIINAIKESINDV